MAEDEVLKLLTDLISFKTVNDPARGIKPGPECPNYIRSYLREHGIGAKILEVDGYYTVFGTLGSGRPVVLLQAHFDVVPVNLREWVSDPFRARVAEGRIYGRGAVDDKANVAALMVVLKRLASREFSGTVVFAFTGDEEVGGIKGAGYVAELLERKGMLPDYVINADGVGMKLIVRRRSAFKAVLRVKRVPKRVTGKVSEKVFRVSTPVVETRHAAYFTPGVDLHPLIAASHFLRNSSNSYAISLGGGFLKSNVVPGEVRLKYVVEGEGDETVEADAGLTLLLKLVLPITRLPIEVDMISEFGVNVTPNLYEFNGEEHNLVFDIRAMLKDVSKLSGSLNNLINDLRSLWGSEVEVNVEVRGRPAYLYTETEAELVKTFVKVLEELGVKFELGEGAGASDSRYYSPKGIQAVDFGPLGGNVHGPNEWVDLNSLKILPDIYHRVVTNLIMGKVD